MNKNNKNCNEGELCIYDKMDKVYFVDSVEKFLTEIPENTLVDIECEIKVRWRKE